MKNYNGYTDGNPYSARLTPLSLSNIFVNVDNAFERCLDGLDDDTRKIVRKHMDEFNTIEEMEMFIKQKTNGGNKFS